MQSFPAQHRQIVEALLQEGRFLLEGEPEFVILKEHIDYYRAFFHSSFSLNVQFHGDYAYLESVRENDAFSRDVCIFLGVLAYELDREGRNLTEAFAFQSFSVEEVEQMLELTSFKEILESSKNLRDPLTRRNFYNRLQRRRIIDRLDEDTFRFTAAHKLFLEYARGLSAVRDGSGDDEEE